MCIEQRHSDSGIDLEEYRISKVKTRSASLEGGMYAIHIVN